MKKILILFLIVLLLHGCAESSNSSYKLEGESANWKGKLDIQEHDINDEIKEEALGTFEYLGDNSDEVNNVVITIPVEIGESGFAIRDFNELSSSNSLEFNLSDKGLLGYLKVTKEIDINISWKENDERYDENIIIELDE
ncbi:hypothetical protein [Planococcus salinus]|uniref:Lipoprotein n=1 Tax=Planococcus salinus TaxID=1848460 RepID=A0A3M8PBG0_9BACL|nr:hypothetical protein [Planococcus salinus]RNF40534.1 hypothetical protein EEX84_03675 [Planococcus salinus]